MKADHDSDVAYEILSDAFTLSIAELKVMPLSTRLIELCTPRVQMFYASIEFEIIEFKLGRHLKRKLSPRELNNIETIDDVLQVVSKNSEADAIRAALESGASFRPQAKQFWRAAAILISGYAAAAFSFVLVPQQMVRASSFILIAIFYTTSSLIDPRIKTDRISGRQTLLATGLSAIAAVCYFAFGPEIDHTKPPPMYPVNAWFWLFIGYIHIASSLEYSLVKAPTK